MGLATKFHFICDGYSGSYLCDHSHEVVADTEGRALEILKKKFAWDYEYDPAYGYRVQTHCSMHKKYPK